MRLRWKDRRDFSFSSIDRSIVPWGVRPGSQRRSLGSDFLLIPGLGRRAHLIQLAQGSHYYRERAAGFTRIAGYTKSGRCYRVRPAEYGSGLGARPRS